MGMLIFFFLSELAALAVAVMLRLPLASVLPMLLFSVCKLIYWRKCDGHPDKLKCTAIAGAGFCYEIGQIMAMFAGGTENPVTTPKQSILYAAAAVVFAAVTFRMLPPVLRGLERWREQEQVLSVFGVPLLLIVLGVLVLGVTAVLGAVWWVKGGANETNGSRNWILLAGVSVQLSEFFKLLYVFVFTLCMCRCRQTPKGIFGFFAYTLVQSVILACLSELGTAMVLGMTALLLGLLNAQTLLSALGRWAGPLAVQRFRRILAGAVIGLVSVLKLSLYLLVTFSSNIQKVGHELQPIKSSRFWEWAVFLNGRFNAVSDQAWNARHAFLSAPLFTLTPSFEPWHKKVSQILTDFTPFVMSAMFGKLPTILFLTAYFAVLCLLTVRACKSGGTFGLAGCAAGILLLVQSAFVVFGVFGIVPFSGMTLPFVSTGGSSLVVSTVLLTILLLVPQPKKGMPF